MAEARAFAKKGGSGFTGKKLTDVYVYRMAKGAAWCYRARYETKSGKEILPFYKTGDGDSAEWKFGEPSAPRKGKPIYRAPEVMDSEGVVFVVEGEKCADALVKLGVHATTSGSAKSASKADWTPLSGRTVVIWPDNDEPGDGYAADVAERLQELGCSVECVDIEALDLPNAGDDAADWLQAHPKAGAADVLALLRTLPPEIEGHTEVTLLRASDIKEELVDWLWPYWLARGAIQILAGEGGTGKTTIAVAIAAAVSSGGKLPDGFPAPVGKVLFWTGEDDVPRVLIPRLKAAGANMDNVFFIDGSRQDGQMRHFDPGTDIGSLVAAARKLGGVSLVVLDPIVSAVMGDSHKNTEVRRGLQPIVDMAGDLNAAVLGISHFAKNTEGRNTADRVIGSVAYTALSRLVWAAAKGQDGKCRLVRAKSNLGPDGDGYEYTLDLVDMEVAGQQVEVSKVMWGQSLVGTARDLLDQAEHKRTQRDDAAEWLYSMLHSGPVAAADIKQQASADGMAWRTVERAKATLDVISEAKAEKGKGRGLQSWFWRLPQSGIDNRYKAGTTPDVVKRTR